MVDVQAKLVIAFPVSVPAETAKRLREQLADFVGELIDEHGTPTLELAEVLYQVGGEGEE